MTRLRVHTAAAGASLFALALTACANVVDKSVDEGPLHRSFRLASAESGVPLEVLLAVGWVESRWQMHDAVVDDEHRPSAGIMGLNDYDASARDLGVEPSDAARVPDLNIKVAAQKLRSLAGHDVPKTLLGWRDALASYGGDAVYADEIFHVLDTGAEGDASTGEHLVLNGRGKGSGLMKSQALSADSGQAVAFLPARDGFWNVGRGQAVDHVVIHTTEGSYAGTIGWFRSSANPYMTSAHYVIRSSDGEITQMVHERDTAYHVLNWNPRAIGIEHEAISSQPEWFTEAMYASSARLVREICDRWGIPMDRQHIVGHVEVPGNDHTDPGHIWDWNHYMDLVTNGSTSSPSGCDGLDFAGQCDGATLRWCENNTVRTVDCSTTAQPACGYENGSVGNNCIAEAAPPAPTPAPPATPAPTTPPAPTDPCAGLDYNGACDGSTLSWCENGAVRSVDCATTAQTACGWENDSVGNNCVDAPPPDPCAGLDYAGSCNGATLSWCENDVVKTFNCASTNQSCGWQNDAVGNNCQ